MMRGPSPRPPPTGARSPAPRPPPPSLGIPPGAPVPDAARTAPSARAPRPAQPPGQPSVRPRMSPAPRPLAGRRSPMPPGAPMSPTRPATAPSVQRARSPMPPAAPGVARARSPMPPGAPSVPRSRSPMPPRPPIPAPAAASHAPAATGLETPMAHMGVRPAPVRPVPDSGGTGTPPAGAAAAAPPPPPPAQPPAGTARSKRAARAYHQDATAPLASAGWNDVQARPAPQQTAWQQEAADRLAARGVVPPAGAPSAPGHAGAAPTAAATQAELDSAMDLVPGQRNSISAAQLAANRASMHASSGVSSAVAGMPGASGAGRAGGARPKIDPDQIPSPVDAQYADQQFFNHEFFGTCSREGLPLSTTNYAAVDQGNAVPKFMRLTTYCLPSTDEVAATSRLPIALTVQPFAQQRVDEAPVPLTNPGEQGPPRCKRCRAYINPWALFVEGGTKWVCPFCSTATEVSPEYFCNLDISGRRVDLDVRPELTHGSVDFAVPREYWAVQSSGGATSMLPAATAEPVSEMAHVTTTTRIQESVDRFTDNLANGAADTSAAARAAKVAGEAALGTLNLGKGQTTVRAPRPLTYMFAIDVSFSAVRCGALQVCAEAIRETLYGPARVDGAEVLHAQEPQPLHAEAPGFGLPPGSRVCIITFDQAVQFYNLDASLEQAQMLVVPDIDDPFVPISGGLLVDPWASRHVIEALLRDLPKTFAETASPEAALGAAVRSAQAALTFVGGQLNVFLSTIPTVGPGKLKHREDTKLYGTDNEKNLFTAQDPFYVRAGEELAMAGVGVNMFLFPSQFINVATLGHLTGETGGELFFHPRFDPVRDGSRVVAEVQRTVLRETAYNVTMRMRCSHGLRVVKQYGNFHQHNMTDLEAGTWDADKAFTALVKHDARLEESQEAYFQCAVLYTSATGERRVRSHTIAVPVTGTLGNVFRYADMDSAVAFYAKEAVNMAHNKSLKDVRAFLTGKAVAILSAYRRNCASSTSPGQLILPESFKLFPLYVLALMKTKALKGGNVSSDVRAFFFRLLLGLGVGNTMVLLYPRMMSLHNLSGADGFPVAPRVGLPPEKQAVEDALLKVTQYPHPMRPSFARMEAHGAYLLENGEWCLLWLGASVSPQLLEDLYGVSSLDEIDPRMTTLPKLPTVLSEQVRNLVAAFAVQRGKPSMQVIVARQNRDGMEVEFANNLVEDPNNDAMSYVDYLCHVHRIISSDMSAGREESASSSLWKGFS
ncbi:COPII coat Sec23p-Sfb3p heterodimer component [Malassezia sp. CBS 17886]|nr:COPII coat Sec23p-Sfb3p heterodimer component [Malassezia sp. CBS 17886]